MHRNPLHRVIRKMLAAAFATLLAAAAACSGSSLDSTSGTDGALTIGLVWPQSGPYQAIGGDQAKGWQLYLDQHGGKLGGHTVTTPSADEGTSGASALTAAKKLVEADHAIAVVGTASGEANAQIAAYTTGRKLPFVGAGGRASIIHDVTWVWNTSWLSEELGKAIAPYIAQHINGPVYAIGPDYQGGWDNVKGFTNVFTAAPLNGKLANPGGEATWTPWPTTTNFLPYLNKIKDSGAKAVFTFYAGTAAVAFLQQYQQAKLGIPLYASGFLTEGSVLAAEGSAADGVYTVLNYSSTLPNPANQAFATAFQAKYQAVPTIYSVAGWDAAQVLDQAITNAGPHPDAATINAAIGKLGSISSPRGDWRFGSQHSPIQTYYLRQVQVDGRTTANVVQETLTTLSN